MKDFEEIINKDHHLSQLLNDKEITVFSNFSNNQYSTELTSYIQEKYLKIFREIYRKSIKDHNLGQANSLIRSTDYLATEETKRLIAVEFDDTLKRTYEYLESFKASLSSENQEISFRAKLEETIDGLTINILNRFAASENIKNYKNKIVRIALEICDLVSNVKPQRHPFKFAVYGALLNNLSAIDNLGSFQERFELHQGKNSKKETKIEAKYVVLLAIVFTLIVLKILSKLN